MHLFIVMYIELIEYFVEESIFNTPPRCGCHEVELCPYSSFYSYYTSSMQLPYPPMLIFFVSRVAERENKAYRLIQAEFNKRIKNAIF